MTVKLLPQGTDFKKKNKFSLKVDKALNRLKIFYRDLLQKSLLKRKVVMLLFVGLMIFSIFLYSFVGFEFLPEMDAGVLMISFDFPAGTTYEEKEQEVYRVEKYLEEMEEVDLIFTQVGTDSSDLLSDGDGSIDLS